MDNSGDIGRNSSTVLVEIAGHHPHLVYSDQDGPGASAKLSSINGLWNVGSACFIADESILRLYTPAQEFQNWMEILRDGHEAYSLVEKRLGDNYRSRVRQMPYNTKIEALNRRKTYFETWRSEVVARPPGNKTAGMGK